MASAYTIDYLESAQDNLGCAFDFAINYYHMSLTDFWRLFTNSSYGERFSNGDFTIIEGRSGIELVYLLLNRDEPLDIEYNPVGVSQEYWLGWALAYFQREYGISFKKIAEYLNIEDLQSLYNPYHEMDIKHFSNRVFGLIMLAKADSKSN